MLLALRITIKIDCIYSLSMVLGTLTVCFSFVFWFGKDLLELIKCVTKYDSTAQRVDKL